MNGNRIKLWVYQHGCIKTWNRIVELYGLTGSGLHGIFVQLKSTWLFFEIAYNEKLYLYNHNPQPTIAELNKRHFE